MFRYQLNVPSFIIPQKVQRSVQPKCDKYFVFWSAWQKVNKKETHSPHEKDKQKNIWSIKEYASIYLAWIFIDILSTTMDNNNLLTAWLNSWIFYNKTVYQLLLAQVLSYEEEQLCRIGWKSFHQILFWK